MSLQDAEARRLYDQATLLAGIGAWECELATQQLSWTAGVYDLFGLPRGSTLHRPSTVELYTNDSRTEMERLRAAMVRTGKGFVLDARITTAEGSSRWMRLSADITHKQGRPWRIYGAKQDITGEKQMWQGLRQLAYSDPLTGLANRRAFEAQLAELRRIPADGCALGALALIDLDMFKPINDHLGHAAGDECLRQVALRLEATLSDALTIARIGGDEFALLICSTAGSSHILHRLNQALAALARPVTWNGRLIEISASIGATMLLPGRHHDPDRSFAEADSALYVAKASGRNRLHLFGEPLQGQPSADAMQGALADMRALRAG